MATSESRQLRLIHVIDRLNVGGATPFVLLATARLNELGHDVRVAKGQVALGEAEMTETIDRSGVCPIEIPGLGRAVSPRHDLKAFIALHRLLRAVRPHVIHTHKSKAGVLGRLAARLSGVPVVIHTYHGHVFHGYFSSWKSAVIVFLERILAHSTDVIMAVSHSQRADLLAYRIAPPGRVRSIPLGLDLDPFLGTTRTDDGFRRELGFSPSAPLVGIVGRLAPIKAVEIFLRAARLIWEACPESRFVVVGDGDCRAELENLTDRLGLKDCVTFTGFRSDVARIYGALDLTLLSSYNEGMPVSLIEAVATGCYIVATNVGGVTDLVDTEKIGLTVPPGRPEALADAAILALNEKRTVSSDQRKRANRRFGIDRLVVDLERLYEDASG